MTPYFHSCCNNGNVVRKEAQSERNTGRKYYACPCAQGANFGCGYFLWEDELIICRCLQGICRAFQDDERKGHLHMCPIDGDKNCGFSRFVERERYQNKQPSSSPGPSSSGKGCPSPGPSSPGPSSANCPNCKLYKMKIKLLEEKLKLASCHGTHESTTLDELLATMEALLLG